MKLKLFNTQSRICEEITCEEGKKFGIYCCGPTVYGPAHIGNFRTYIVQDSVIRLLKLLGITYCYVRNLTDVDDKTICGSIKQHQSLSDYTRHWIEIFHHDCQRLNLLPPTIEPLATETVAEQQALIKTLIDKRCAYVRNGSVYFRIASFKNYGKLSNLEARMLQMQALNSAGDPNDADEYDREQVADFVLWKAYKPEDGSVFWESPWGRGRPGWHSECSAMSHQFLGRTIDLHSGGVDLCFPHHENEIAQSESAYGGPFVRHWMHIAHLQVEKQKMSKSLGNLFTLDDLQAKHYDAAAVRYALLAGHYRQPLNFTFDLLHSSQSALHKIYIFTQSLLSLTDTDSYAFDVLLEKVILQKKCCFLQNFFDALLDDLNVPKALGCLFSFIHANPIVPREQGRILLTEWAACLYALGISWKKFKIAPIFIPKEIQELAQQRWASKIAHSFREADVLRQRLEQFGWKVIDDRDFYTLEPLNR